MSFRFFTRFDDDFCQYWFADKNKGYLLVDTMVTTPTIDPNVWLATIRDAECKQARTQDRTFQYSSL